MRAFAYEPSDLIEDLAFLAAHGIGGHEAARRVGMTSAKTLDKWLRRHNRADLANQLHRQEPLSLVPSRKER